MTGPEDDWWLASTPISPEARVPRRERAFDRRPGSVHPPGGYPAPNAEPAPQFRDPAETLAFVRQPAPVARSTRLTGDQKAVYCLYPSPSPAAIAGRVP